MDPFPFGYHRIHEASWAYLSSLLMLALFFKFNRVWTFRNLDLILLILIAPGILLVNYHDTSTRSETGASIAGVSFRQAEEARTVDGPTGDDSGGALSQSPELQDPAPAIDAAIPATPSPEVTTFTREQQIQRIGYIWLFCTGGLWLLRMMLDPVLVRRPMLESNLSIGGLVFLGCSLMTFIFADIITSRPQAGSLDGAIGAMKIVQRRSANSEDRAELVTRPPGYALMHLFPIIPTFTAARQNDKAMLPGEQSLQLEIAAKTVSIAGQILLVFGLIAIGHYHFSNFRNGIGIAVIWLMMPYSIMYSGSPDHVLPAAFLVWAVALYRQPVWSGVMLGLAAGVSYYPLFLLPLWISFFWEARVGRFIMGVAISLVFCVAGLVFTSENVAHFFLQLQAMFGFWLPRIDQQSLDGIWVLGWESLYRLPVLVAFVALSVSFVFWPARKNLGVLIAFTAAVMIAVQFWHGYKGGTFVAWYLPLVLCIVFRPNLVDRFAIVAVPPQRRKSRVDSVEQVDSAA